MFFRNWIGLAVCLVLTLSSCSHEKEILPGSTQYEITVTNAIFQPALWRVPAGEKITLRINNLDQTQHNSTILLRHSTQPFSAIDPADIYFQKQLEPNTATVIEFRAPPAPGEYQVLSTLADDAEKGLIGTLVVVQLPSE